jgi:hypothetical protein
MYVCHYHLGSLHIRAEVPPPYSFSPISDLAPGEFVQKKHRVERTNPSVLRTPYSSAKNGCGFQTPFPKMSSMLVLSLQCLLLVKPAAWRQITLK